jgi:hypothetical protein
MAAFVAALWGTVISCAWWWLPQLLWPQEHADPQGGWWLVAVPFWSLLAGAVAVITLLIARRLLARGARDAA